MVIGAGVAGLAAIGAANSLGAIVRAFDTRPEVKEQVQSMGAEFLELDFKEEAGSGDGYAKVMSEAFIKAEMALFARAGERGRYHCHHGVNPGQTGAEADHPRNGRLHEIGQRGGRSGLAKRRQL
ncbi:NAD(P) transhydrogenase subunit alpha [Klebsiella pneumoniae]|uniref:proton-translocating NAD(P)(+) transhydrogenase n=1 Tax=Klebsiella pneumoniae TaxID=573 RepID=A0A377ZVQ1_KLEPN|nr:NAD(P) transhydrogenase subunit alpha [Klebsiella pneumoniae]